MSISSSLAIIAGMWGVLMSISPVLQIRTIVRTGSSAGVSSGHLRVLLVGFVLWLAYGLAISNSALIVTNTVSIVAYSATLVTVHRHRPMSSHRA